MAAENPAENINQQLLLDMANDITGWFNPNQGWEPQLVQGSIISLNKIANASTVQGGPNDGAPTFRAKIDDPDKHIAAFSFQAKEPPLTRGWFGKSRKADLLRAFSPSYASQFTFKDKAKMWREESIDVHPDKIGPIYPLEQAVEKLTNPFYLVLTTVSLHAQDTGGYYSHLLRSSAEKPVAPNIPTNLLVVVITKDLAGYLRLEESRLRELRKKVEDRFALIPHED